jgi:hypothetical protein
MAGRARSAHGVVTRRLRRFLVAAAFQQTSMHNLVMSLPSPTFCWNGSAGKSKSPPLPCLASSISLLLLRPFCQLALKLRCFPGAAACWAWFSLVCPAVFPGSAAYARMPGRAKTGHAFRRAAQTPTRPHGYLQLLPKRAELIKATLLAQTALCTPPDNRKCPKDPKCKQSASRPGQARTSPDTRTQTYTAQDSSRQMRTTI